jgi:hypothetical protein
MTWTKTSDDFPEALYGLSSDAYRLHHAATTLANRLLLDGRIPKKMLHLIAVPTTVRRRAVIREVIDAGLWRDDGQAWTLTDFFPAQPTKEEVETQREYDAVRQRIRFAKTPEAKTELRRLEEEAKTRLNEAHERKRALLSQCESQRVSRGDSHRPVPPRPAPSRLNEDEDGTPSPGSSLSAADPGEAVTPEELRALRELPSTATLREKVTVFGSLPPDDRPTRSKSRPPRP